ncbi:hypothetical protein BBAD15_g4465 [Beauveria bassiana D1-5]|uniref:Uncharacterized protein n=1 Tax=Beauveria bassiana D1-5 TaxID=1245745 RepID=A0A0A2VRJ4_BEABA|nr:hypothetical protein BBAD15_g4465 [Beauveria bassiana D1-5]
MFVRDCRELVEAMLQQEFEGSGMEATTIVYKNAEEIMKTSKMGLWAQSAVQESVVINMRMPGIKRFLRNLAEMGVGVTAEYQGVLYKFVPSTCEDASFHSALADEETRRKQISNLERRRPAPVCSVLRLDCPKWEWVVT